jgi:hypothetical protein
VCQLPLSLTPLRYGNLQWCGIGQLRPVVDYSEGMAVEARYDEDEKCALLSCVFWCRLSDHSCSLRGAPLAAVRPLFSPPAVTALLARVNVRL